MLQIINSQLQIYKDATDETEAWKADHNEVMASYEFADRIEDLVQFSLDIYEFLSARNKRLRIVSSETALQACKVWKLWIECSECVLALMNKSAQSGFPISNADQFVNCLSDAQATKESLATIEHSIQQAVDGRTKNLSEAFNELRSGIDGRSSGSNS